jgi:hypothetical protein
MPRIAVSLFAVLGLLLAAAGLITALAWGLPALGLNANGRNPLDATLRGLSSAAGLYATGAALLAIATRWIRNRYGPLPPRGIWVAASFTALLCLWQAVLGYWANVPALLFFTIGIAAPIALGGWPWGSRLNQPVRP